MTSTVKAVLKLLAKNVLDPHGNACLDGVLMFLLTFRHRHCPQQGELGSLCSILQPNRASFLLYTSPSPFSCSTPPSIAMDSSLKPGMLLKMLQHINSDFRVAGPHRSVLLQIISIVPALSGPDLWPKQGFHLKVADASHSMYVTVSVQHSHGMLVMTGKLHLGQFLYVERLEPGSPFPRLVGIKPLPVRHSSVFYAEELEARVSQIPQKKIMADISMGRSSSKKSIHSGGGKAKASSGDETVCKWEKPRAPSVRNCLAQETAKNRIKDRRRTSSEIKRRECCAAVQRIRDFDSRQTACRSNSDSHPSLKINRYPNAILSPEHNLPRYNAFLFEKTPSKCLRRGHSEVKAKAVSCSTSHSKQPCVSSRSKSISAKDEVLSNQTPNRKEQVSRNSTVGWKCKNGFPPVSASVQMLPQDVATLCEKEVSTVSKQDKISPKRLKGTRGRLHTSETSSTSPKHPCETVAWNVLPASVAALAEDITNLKHSAFLTAMEALQEASAAESVIRNVRMFAEMCSLSKPEFPTESMRKYFKLCRSLERTKSMSDEMADGLRTDHLVAVSNGFNEPHELHKEKLKGAAAWVAMALSRDLFHISSSDKHSKRLDSKFHDHSASMVNAEGILFKGYDSVSHLRRPLSEKASPWKIQNTSVKRKTSATHHPDTNMLPCFESDAMDVINQLTSYLQMKENGSENNNCIQVRRALAIANSAQKLQDESQKWFFSYLERSLDCGFHLNLDAHISNGCVRKTEGEVLASVLPHLKEVNDWIGQLNYESLDAAMLNVLERLKKKICQFLFQQLETSIL